MQTSIVLLLLIAILAANLPFASERIGGVVAVSHKRARWRVLEFLVLYLAVGLFARVLEARQMPVHEQDWPFYVCTFALFVVFAFPGFVLRFLWKRRAR